nr:MAG TPA: hypothetical protein [Caudoviricetes sp.]
MYFYKVLLKEDLIKNTVILIYEYTYLRVYSFTSKTKKEVKLWNLKQLKKQKNMLIKLKLKIKI